MRSITLAGPPALPTPLRGPSAVMAVLAALVCTMLAVRYAGGSAAGQLDTRVRTAVQGVAPDPGHGPLLIDFLGEPLPAIVLVGLLVLACLALGRRRLAVVAVAGAGLTGVVTTALKPVVDRTIHGGFLAYPSGHTAALTALALVVMLLVVDLLGAGRWPGLLLILSGAGGVGGAMALSQVALDAHYPSDTAGGWCAAVAVVLTTAYLTDRFAGPGRSLAGEDQVSGAQPVAPAKIRHAPGAGAPA